MDLTLGAAAGGADALREILRQKFQEAVANAEMANRARSLDIEQQRANSDEALRAATQKSLDEERAANKALRLQQVAKETAADLSPGDVLDEGTTSALKAGNLNSLIQHQGPVLASTAMQGIAQAGPKTPTVGPMSVTENAGHGEQDVYRGTAAQQEQLAQRKALRMMAMRDPNSPIGQWVQLTGGHGAPPAELFKPANQPVMRVDPRTGQMSQVGEAPTGAHFVTEPAPKDTSVSDANRSQQSYQYHATQLANLRKPVEDQAAKISDLNDQLSQGTPQADALVAPKLLSTLVGGQGTGLRMNEAEIARVVGGRSKWESLKASANQWSLDPRTANSITPEQRQQIHALVDAAAKKNAAQLKTLDDAGDALSTSSDPMQHRAILNGVHKALTAISTGGAVDNTGKTVKAPSASDPLGIR